MKMNLPELPAGAKCLRCRSQATIRTPSHHANFCPDCFSHYFHTAVRRAMKKFRISKEKPLMVAVSGGKDSLAVWEALTELGYRTKGLHVNLGIEGFSDASSEAVSNFAEPRGFAWVEYSLDDVFGYSIPEIKRRSRRKICSLCGLLKRQMLNRLTVSNGFDALVVGHNLDDEAGRLMGNLLRHRYQYLEKQYPFLPSPHPRMPAKLKPLYRLESYEIRTYCRLKGIVPLEAKCPMSRGATSHIFKEALDFLEEKMPGTKRDFLFSYLERKPMPEQHIDFGTCGQCNEPTYSDMCSVCNLANHLKNQEENSQMEGL